MLKPLPVDRSAGDASISLITFIAHVGFSTQELAHMLDSLVRVADGARTAPMENNPARREREKARGYGATAARLSPDQKVGSSGHTGANEEAVRRSPTGD